jgi:hypothetical protein
MRSQGRFFPCCVRASMTANSCRCLRCAALFRPVSRGMPRGRDLTLTLSGRQRSGCRRFASFVQTSEGVLPKGSGWPLRTSRSSGSESSATIRSAGGGCRVSASGRPFFGFFGLGYGLYYVGQATRRKNASVIAAPHKSHHRRVWRPAVIRLKADVTWNFVAVALGMVAFGVFALPPLVERAGMNEM